MKSPSTVFLLIFAHNGDGAAAANRVNGPVMLQKFDSGVMVIQSKTHSDEESTVDTQGSAKRVKQCVKWFQQLEGNYGTEQEKLKNLLEVAEKKCSDVELMMKENEDELNSIIMELRKNLDMLQEKHAKKELDKLRESKLAAEKVQASLLEELKRTQEDNASNIQKIQSLNDMYKRLQEYNTSLKLYNSRLQSELHETNETLKHVEKEKTTVVEKP
ncbi:kinesin 3 [Perilla frutescens var. hirtella]|nr:kinesin 3 [Perilla frutescens var. frutescens]KAH6800908.1 kinesin 3 [Perilla frutescens var. hirtella]